jgi:hypothetical protein
MKFEMHSGRRGLGSEKIKKLPNWAWEQQENNVTLHFYKLGAGSG